MFKKFIFASIITSFSFSNNYSLSFDGVDDYVEMGENIVIENNLTVELWVKPSSLLDRKGLLSTRRNEDPGAFQLEVGTNDAGTNVIAVGGQNTWVAYTESNAIVDDQWVHIAYTRDGDGDNHAIYVNGVLQNITTNLYSFQNNSSAVQIGRGTMESQYFEGNIARISLWNSALSASEIQLLMTSGSNGDEENLVFSLNFNEGNGSVSTDLSGNGNDGTIYGATWSDNVPSFG